MSQEALLYTGARVNHAEEEEEERPRYLMGLRVTLPGLQRSYSRLRALLHGLFAFVLVQPNTSYRPRTGTVSSRERNSRLKKR